MRSAVWRRGSLHMLLSFALNSWYTIGIASSDDPVICLTGPAPRPLQPMNYLIWFEPHFRLTVRLATYIHTYK